MRVFTGGIATETNTFAPFPTGMDDFAIVRAADVKEEEGIQYYGTGINVWKQRCEERNWEFIFSLYGFAQPAGITVRFGL